MRPTFLLRLRSAGVGVGLSAWCVRTLRAPLCTLQPKLEEKPAVVVKSRHLKKWLAQERESLQEIIVSPALDNRCDRETRLTPGVWCGR